MNNTISLWRALNVANFGQNFSSTNAHLALNYITIIWTSLIKTYFSIFQWLLGLFINSSKQKCVITPKETFSYAFHDNDCFNSQVWTRRLIWSDVVRKYDCQFLLIFYIEENSFHRIKYQSSEKLNYWKILAYLLCTCSCSTCSSVLQLTGPFYLQNTWFKELLLW